jgi:hypothetical protein
MLWQAGLAHRDIKPANLLVRDGHVMLIDVAFAQVHPSPWRQAIDLANMMLVLAVRTDAERVYQRALDHFTPDEIAEAFAAARGVASPTQLRTVMKQDGRDLLAEFRALAPTRRPISLQRWGPKRVLLAAGLAIAAIFVFANVYSMFTPADLPVNAQPTCGTDDVMILIAQAVPSAVSVPCIAAVPAGWDVEGVHARRGLARFRLEASGNEVEVTLRPPGNCTVEGASEVPTDEVGMRRFERPEQLPPDLRMTRTYLYEGGCVTYRLELEGDAGAQLIHDVDAALAFHPRGDIVRDVDERSGGLSLCGAEAPRCVGE